MPTETAELIRPETGRRTRANTRQLKQGERVVQTGNIVRVLDENDNVTHESVDPPGTLASGWVAYASWTNNSSTNLIQSMTTRWTVPRPPTTSSGQIIFLFNGLQNSNRILQPVLQWGSDSDDTGSGAFWVIASWNAGPQGGTYFVSPSVIRVNPGQDLEGSMTYTGSTNVNGTVYYNYNCTFVGYPGTNMPYSTTQALYNPVETLEVYGITKCSDYPSTNTMAMRNINIGIGGGIQPVMAANTPSQNDCGEEAIVLNSSGSNGDVLICFRRPAPWNINNLSVAANAPAAIGSPHAYTYDKDGTEHVVYRGADNNIHELWLGTGTWSHNNLSALTGAPAPAGNPFGYQWTVDGTEHVVYRGVDGHIHELWFNGAWHVNDLTAAANAPLAVNDPVAHTYASDKTEHVIYRGVDGHIHELWFASKWQHNDLTVASGAPAGVAGDPCSYVYPRDNTQHVVYIAGNGHVIEMWFNGTWHSDDLTASAGAPVNAGVGTRPTGYFYAADNTQHVVYRCNDGSIEELWYNGSKWSANLISAAAGGSAPAVSDPVGYTFSSDNTEHVLYMGAEGDVHELWFNGVWNYNDLSKSTTPTAPVGSGNPTGYMWSKDGTEHAIYTSTAGQIIELWL